jgi:hypothetical protein
MANPRIHQDTAGSAIRALLEAEMQAGRDVLAARDTAARSLNAAREHALAIEAAAQKRILGIRRKEAAVREEIRQQVHADRDAQLERLQAAWKPDNQQVKKAVLDFARHLTNGDRLSGNGGPGSL